MQAMTMMLMLAGSLPVQVAPIENLDFSTGTLKGWENEGFYITTPDKNGPSLNFAVCSSDNGKPGRTGLLHRQIVIPRGAGAIRFTAYAVMGKDCRPANDMDIGLFAAGMKPLPKLLPDGKGGWKEVPILWAREESSVYEYTWKVSDYVGQPLRLALLDNDKRPGCYLVCTGFRIIPHEQFEGKEFTSFMTRLVTEQKLLPVSKYRTEHFVALSNADDAFSAMRLNNCELIYDLFLDHFQKKGLSLREPGVKMMVAIFDSQAGFEAYLGQKMSPNVTGMYHPVTNRLVVYDYGQNESFVGVKRQISDEGKRIGVDIDRQRYVATANRRAKEFSTEANIGTIMHEVAHQLSFNTGMLNREGDVPLWLAEGMACYCEATDNGSWQGLGERNPERLECLAAMLAGKHPRLSIDFLINGDDWLHGKNAGQTALIGYAESWALFRMLMEEKPKGMRTYLNLVYQRRTPEHRVTDFLQAFGQDAPRMELRFGEYIKEMLASYGRTRR